MELQTLSITMFTQRATSKAFNKQMQRFLLLLCSVDVYHAACVLSLIASENKKIVKHEFYEHEKSKTLHSLLTAGSVSVVGALHRSHKLC
jgi:hypothetical protein